MHRAAVDWQRGGAEAMDWSGCELVEVVEGVPEIKGTGVSAESVLETFRAEVAWHEVMERYREVPTETMHKVLQYAAGRLAWDDETLVDWSGCSLVERVAGRCAGAPTVIGTRIFPDTVVGDYELGCSIQEISESYPSLPMEVIEGLIAYAGTRRQRSAA